MLDRIRIVLVRPIRAGNVGATCRALMNMGLTDLVIVSPKCALDDPQALGFAARAKSLLESARVVDSIAEALDGCVLTFASTGKGGMYRRQAASTAREAAKLALQTASRGPVAIAFGPEDRGFVLEELREFDRVIEIPAAPEYPVLNLAAAVMVVAYEMYQAHLAQSTPPSAEPDEPPATDSHKRILYDRLFTALDRIGFFSRQQTSDHLRFAIRRVLGRTELSVNEADVLIGMASQIHWYVNQQSPRDDSTPSAADD